MFFTNELGMNMRSISVALLLLCCFTKLSSCSNNQADFADVSVNCGSSGASAARSGQKWLGDVRSKLTPFLQLGGLSAASTAVNKFTVADPVPHNTARISRSQFSYAFQLNQGQKIVRLHFNPTEYRGFNGLKDLFTVEAGSFTLLSNFSTSLTADFLGVDTFSKEFCLMIQEKQKLSIVFSAQSLDTYAYVNGIEIISVPASLSYFVGGDIGIRVIGQNSLVYVDNTTALETVHQISTKQDLVSSADGSRDIFAIRLNQRVDNKTWTMPVDVGFSYLIRLHLSEFSNVGLNYKVLINQVFASSGYGTVKERDDSRYVDYVVAMNGRKQEGKRNILICLQSNQEHMDMHGPFKGFEILKLSNRDNSLAAPNPQPSAQDSPSKTFRHVFMILGRSHRNAIATIAIAAISLMNIIVHELRGRWEASGSEEENKPSAGAERVCRRFSLAEIKLATGDFNEGFVIGNGGFGKVYKGLIDDWQKTVAVKKLKPNSKQGEREFITEIETLSEILHNNVVSLIGYCSEHAEMIIVYEYMARGTLADHLYKLPRADSEFSCLTWKQRLNICIGVARGLEYLHTGRGIIHRDLKASNILLDENLVAKVSDFGLAKPEKRNKLHSHVSTNVKGTNGYIDPYYKTTSKLIRKSDTYSFGVVLLEVLCGRRAVDSKVPPDERILTKWAQDKISKGEVDRIIASSIREEISPNSLKTFVGVAGRCLDNEPKNRPTMSEVVLQLEFSLKQQESNQNLVLNEIPSVSDAIHPSTSNDRTDIRSTKHTTTYLPLPQHAHTSGKVVVDAEVTSGRKQWTKFTTIKLLKFRPWQAFWKRVKTSKKDKWPFSDLDVIYDVDNLQYEYSRIRAATRNFSEANKLGEGGFGPVYKGILLNGKEIAVKRLSANSMQGNREFKNELLLLANLQHRNLIRLLGFCLESSERLLIYEFVENSSLDRFIFDPLKRSYLDWNRLHKIIQGIAMGLVYLHQDSRLRIIHRDLKASNVLLDGDWNPKVADFGIARLSGGDETQGETTRVMGTSGYMAPEYLVKGQVSDKTDVFSFGVLVLEILRGQRSSHFQNEEKLSFVDRGWKSWSEGTVANLIDPTLRANTGSLDDVLRCFHIGLLCVQENPSSRPTMASVSLMLSTSTAELPVPSMPAFYMSNAQIFSSEDTCSPYTSYEGQSISKCYVSDEEAPMLTYRRRGRKAEITD